jgi:protein phosphatase
MAAAVVQANERILAEADADPTRAGMGTTLTALKVSASTGGFFCAHIGDSRAYVFSEGRLKQLTRDHTWVQDMVDEGKISSDVSADHPLRHILSKALGIGRPVEPEIVEGRGQPGDLFLVCTDGLVGMLTDAEIEDFLNGNEDLELDGIVEGLVGMANERGGSDNITVAVLRLG